jgi:hypothetical protein
MKCERNVFIVAEARKNDNRLKTVQPRDDEDHGMELHTRKDAILPAAAKCTRSGLVLMFI